jgi:hypothetical protein
MDYSKLINERVEVVALFHTGVNANLLCFPSKMKYKNRVIEFSELGLRHPTTQGKRMIHVFDMSDGVNDYRLEFDAEGLIWTLVAITEVAT